ncbi:hypothetical protein C8F04DRAFT_405582, partial [Mycena alexandri]
GWNVPNPGYGSLHLCLVAPGDITEPASKPCRQLMDDFRHLPLDSHLPTLLANWNGFGVSHVALTHFEHNLFNATGLFVIPTGNTSDSKPWVQAETHPGFVGEFAVEGKLGVGLRGSWGAGAALKAQRRVGEGES